MRKPGACQGKFDQDAKDRAVCLAEDRIVAENMSMQAACQAVAFKAGNFMAHGLSMDLTPARRAGNIPDPVPENFRRRGREATS